MHYSERSQFEVLKAAYEELHGESLDLNRLLKDLLLDCGVDGTGLNPQDLVDVFDDAEDSKWRDVQFACAACLAGYSASGECSNIEFVRSLAAMFIVSNGIRRGYGDWERSFDFMIAVLDANRLKCSVSIRMDALKVVLCSCDGQVSPA